MYHRVYLSEFIQVTCHVNTKEIRDGRQCKRVQWRHKCRHRLANEIASLSSTDPNTHRKSMKTRKLNHVYSLRLILCRFGRRYRMTSLAHRTSSRTASILSIAGVEIRNRVPYYFTFNCVQDIDFLFAHFCFWDEFNTVVKLNIFDLCTFFSVKDIH